MTKDTEEFSQFAEPVECREYILPRDEKSTDPKGWIRGNTKIGPVLEVTTSYLQGKYGVEIRNESVNKDNSHSWVRISHGLNKLVTDLIDKEYDDNEQETSETKSEEFALETCVLPFASRSKAKAKPRRSTSACSSARTVPIRERIWTDIEPRTQSNLAYVVAKRLNTLLRHGELPREENVATEFWRIKDYLRNEFENSRYWSDEMWKSRMAGGGGNKKRFQYCTDSSGAILYLRALQGHSGRNLIGSFITGQCLDSGRFLRVHLSRRTCNQVTFHHQFGIDTWRSTFEQQTDRQKGFKFYQTRSNAIILYDSLPAYCFPKAIMLETGDIIFEKVYASPRPPLKISFRENWMKELGSEVAGGSEDSQQIQPTSQTQLSSTGRLVKSFVPVSVERVDKDKDSDENVDADQTSTGRPVSGQPTGLSTQLEAIDIDFRVSGLPHAVVKQAENFRVREFVKKMESHPHRQALQANLQQSKCYNPCIDDSKAMIREMVH